jgi:2-polyprenyl-3-methyl-5-hydroxy-6-metoxy-1,4-benzoquinol methylase
MRKAGAVVTDEWQLWEHRGPMTPAKYKQLYRQSQAYVFELGDWHLWNADKRKSDLALVDQLRDAHPQHVLVFGSGAPLLAIPLARAGLDVTIGDVDSNMLRFGAFRAERRGVHVKSWRAGVDPAPPEPSYDAIIVLDMLEHLPREELAGIVDQLIALKTPKTQIIAEAPGGKTWLHAALDDASRQQLQRLQTELPGR